MVKSKAAWFIDEKTDKYKAKIQVWEDGTAEYTLSRPVRGGVLDAVLGRKLPWMTERKRFSIRRFKEELPHEVQRLLRRMKLPPNLSS